MNQDVKEKNLDKIQLLTWTIEGQIYGADINYCLEVQKDVSIVQVPHSKDYIAGIVNLRGDVVTVLDLLVLLNQKEKASREKCVIIRFNHSEKQVAIKADAISDVIDLPRISLEEASLHIASDKTRYIPKVAHTSNGFILIFNAEELFVVK